MSVAEVRDHVSRNPFPVTRETAQWAAGLQDQDIPQAAIERATHVLLDWLGCTIAGQSEPLVAMLREEIAGDGRGDCTLIASGAQARLHDAALINGAAAHALDYDDVNRRLHGHPTACIAPAVMALGEVLGSSGHDVLVSFIIGTEVACSLGEMSEDGHYEAGFHATGTLGTFGAAVATAKLMRLDADQTAMALGIAASQASGLKANFGTMTKPFHAGKAAMNGLLSARLAARGFTASDKAIEGAHGFAQAQMPGFEGGPIRTDEHAPYAVEQMLYKYHAACFLTHSTLNAIQELRSEHGFTLDDVKAADIRVRSTHSSVCCIPEPVSGLEIKFSILHLAAMGLDGADTSALETYNDASAVDLRYVAARQRIRLDLVDDMDRSSAVVKIELKGGSTLKGEANVGIPEQDTDTQWRRLSAKFASLTEPHIGKERTASLTGIIADLEHAKDIRALLKAAS